MFAALVLGVACGEGTAPPAPVATVTTDAPQGVEIVPGGTQMVVAIPKDAGGRTLSDRITTWTSSDPAIATVSAGLVAGVTVGNAQITVSVEGKTTVVDVRVKDGAVVGETGNTFSVQSGIVGVSVPPAALTRTVSLTVAPSTTAPANPRLLPGTAFDFGPASTTFAQPVVLTIRYNPSTIAPDSPESGLQLYEVTGSSWRVVSGSTVNTTAKTVTGSVTRLGTYGVMMQPKVETVAIGGDLSPMPVVTTRQLSATIRDNEGTTLSRTTFWTSSDPAILSIDASSGLATAKVPGSVTITATSEGKSGTATITVVPGPPAKLIANAGNNQSVAAGAAVPVPPSVKVTDAGDNPIANVAVTFVVTGGGGTVTAASATTNTSGIATVGGWTLGTVAGPNTLTATSPAISGASVVFQAAGGAGPAAAIALVAGNNQTATAGGFVATPPSVKVTDANGNFISGFTVLFAPSAGSGSVTGGSAVTNSAGIATVGSWRLGPTPGAQSLLASADGLSGSPVTFTATGTAPVPSTIAAAGGNDQSARPGFAVATVPSVRVTDPAGIPVPGIAVTFAITAGGGSIGAATATTNGEGIASPGSWTLGPTVGTNTLTASAGSLAGSPVTFNATAVAAPPTNIAINAGDNQNALAGQPVPILPSVRVTDADGVGVSGVSVTFSIRSGAGSISGASQVTNAQGIATIGSWTLGIGGNSLFADVPGLSGSPVVFVALGTAQVQIVTFGDSNTDFGFEGTSPIKRVGSYVSSGDPAIRLPANAPNSPLQLAGKIEARWRANRSQTIKAVNHGISGTTTGAGRTLVLAPNAFESVGGVTRFNAEVMGVGYPWSGGEPVNAFYPEGAILRVNAFAPRSSDFAYVSMGTNDVFNSVPLATVRANLETMIDTWIGAGKNPSNFMITTLAPISSSGNAAIPNLNSMIRTLAQQKGVRLIDIAALTSTNNGLTWTNSSLHVGDFLHFSESVRDVIADQVVSIMLGATPP